MREWQDISTAPRDGTEVLAYGRDEYDGRLYAKGQHVCWWEGNEKGGFWSGRDQGCDYRISHWQPLPPPPNPHSEKADG